MSFVKVVSILTLFVLLVLVSCKPGNATIPTASETGASTAAAADDADSLLFTPAGTVVYKGNLNGANLVPTVTLSFSTDNDTVTINYRADITTSDGTTRNEILYIYDFAGKVRYNGIGPDSYAGDIVLTVVGLPTAITYNSQDAGFAFHISSDAKPGQYHFQINAAINGNKYPLPCTITVR